jgi:hypothetical protein
MLVNTTIWHCLRVCADIEEIAADSSEDYVRRHDHMRDMRFHRVQSVSEGK